MQFWAILAAAQAYPNDCKELPDIPIALSAREARLEQQLRIMAGYEYRQDVGIWVLN